MGANRIEPNYWKKYAKEKRKISLNLFLFFDLQLALYQIYDKEG